MLYFLILLIPFLAFMIYLVRQNNRLRSLFFNILTRMEAVCLMLDQQELINAELLGNEKIITNSSIKELEKALHAIEQSLELKKSNAIANRFAHRIQKLQALDESVLRVEKALKEEKKVS